MADYARLVFMGSPVAILELVEVAADGSRTPLRIELGQPRPDGRGAWACLVSLDGDDRHAKEIYGEDSLQSLCLGLRMVRLHLECAIFTGRVNPRSSPWLVHTGKLAPRTGAV